MRGKCRRYREKEGDLRRKCKESVGGAGKKRRTSDGNARKVSEVSGKREGPPTEMREKCRRCREKEGDLRRKCGESVGGTQQKRGTSDRFAGNLSEVLRLSRVQEVDVDEAVDFLDEFDRGEGAAADVVCGVGGRGGLAVGVDGITKTAGPSERVCRLDYFDSFHLQS